MRAIDGDVLFREMEKAQWYNNADRDEIAEELVLNAPTIEPRCETCEAFNKTRLLIPQPQRKTDMREDAEEPKKCDTCLHEKEPWSMHCHSCDGFKLWEGKR